MKVLFVILIFIGVLAEEPAFPQDQKTIFGITVRWVAKNKTTQNEVTTELAKIEREGKEYFDPDCLWRKQDGGACANRFPKQTAELMRLAKIFREETLGYFDVLHSSKSSTKRDFGGLWEGYTLDVLRQKIKGLWAIDISGDILVKDTIGLKTPLIISDAVFDEVHYADIEMKQGFINTSVSRRLGSQVNVPDTIASNKTGEILKIVIFATFPLTAARSHAWATGIIAGGEKVLDHLMSLDQYRGQWGYFYFRPDGSTVCSKNIVCDLNGPKKKVTVVLLSKSA